MTWKRGGGGYHSEAGRIERGDAHDVWHATAGGKTLPFDLLRDAKAWCEKEHRRELALNHIPTISEILNYAIIEAQRHETIGSMLGGGPGALLTQALMQCSACLAFTDGLVGALREWWDVNRTRVLERQL